MQKIWVCGARGQIGQAVNDVVDKLEFEMFDFIDNLTAQNIPCMLSYVLEHKGEKNTVLEDWINRNNYTYIPLGDIIGISGQPRKEILVLNYDL